MTVVIPLTAKTPPSSRTKLLDNVLSCNDYYIKLFVNELDESNPEFIEASFLGYGQVKLDKDNWRESIIESDLAVSYYKDPVVWSSINIYDVFVYGYYVVDAASTVVWYYKFPKSFLFSKNRGLNIIPKIVLGCPPAPTPTPILFSSKSTYGVYFNIYAISQTGQESFVVRLNENYEITTARAAISWDILDIYLVGKIHIGSKPYNSPWSFYIDPNTIELVYSEFLPNQNFNIPPSEIQHNIENGTFQENTEVCYDFLGSYIKEMELKGVIYCGDPLVWTSRKEIDPETNEPIQIGYCEGNCMENSNKVSDGLTEVCSDVGNPNIYDDYIARRDAAFKAIDEYTENEYVVDKRATLSEVLNFLWTDEERAELQILYEKRQQLNIDELLAKLRARVTPTPTPTPDIGGS
jgi:hypothetical protein